MNEVERAVRASIVAVAQLRTPTGRGAFTVHELRSDALVLLLGQQEAWTALPWAGLEGVADYLRGRGWVKIGGRYNVGSDDGTLDAYLKTITRRATASWVAVVLERAGVSSSSIVSDRPVPVCDLASDGATVPQVVITARAMTYGRGARVHPSDGLGHVPTGEAPSPAISTGRHSRPGQPSATRTRHSDRTRGEPMTARDRCCTVVARRRAGGGIWAPDLGIQGFEVPPEKRKVGGSTPPLPTASEQRCRRSAVVSWTDRSVGDLTASTPQNPPFAARCCTMLHDTPIPPPEHPGIGPATCRRRPAGRCRQRDGRRAGPGRRR